MNDSRKEPPAPCERGGIVVRADPYRGLPWSK